MSPRGKHVRPASRRRLLRPAALLVTAAVAVGTASTVLLTSATTSASFRDHGNLNVATTGVGNTESFDIALVADGLLRQADGDGLVWAVAGSDTLVPGTVLTTVVPVVDNGPYDALVSLSVRDVRDESVDGGLDPFELLRWTVVDDQTGEVLVGDGDDPLASVVDGDGVGAAMAPFLLAARGSAALADGAAWTDGAPGSTRLLRVSIAYPDTPASERFNGGSSAIQLVFDAEST